MGSQGLPSPPAEDHKSTLSRKSTTSSTKSIKPIHRTSKRASSSAATIHHHDHLAHSTGMDGRHKRVWKACERCRMKKTKCDGEFPCKRCKDDGLVCTAGVRKKMEYKQLPRGYAEVLENTQLALIATVHKLYAMVRSGQQWELGEPELNDRGQPVIHNIAQKLGCIRPNSDIDLPVHSVFPEDEADMAELARQLEDQHKDQKTPQQPQQQQQQSQQQPLQQQQQHRRHHQEEVLKDTDSSIYTRTERASSSEIDHSDFEDYRKAAFGSGSNAMTLSPQSFTGSHDFDFAAPPPDMDTSAMFPPPQQQQSSPSMASFPAWTLKTQPGDLTMQFLQAGVMQNMDMLNQGLVESEFGTIKPHVLSCPNPEVMMGMGDPMIYPGYDGEPMRL